MSKNEATINPPFHSFHSSNIIPNPSGYFIINNSTTLS